MKAECLTRLAKRVNTINPINDDGAGRHGNYMTNLLFDEHTFSESMLQLRFQVFIVFLFKGADIVFHPAYRQAGAIPPSF
jgi:hypothetical protein